MSTQMKAEILELGETFVTLLKSPICPPEVRAAVIGHLDQVRKQLDMTNPELVRSVFSFLAATSGLPPSAATTQAQGQAISTVLAAAAPSNEESLKPFQVPVAMNAPAPVAPAAAEAVKTSGNLAARLSASAVEV